MTIEYGFEYILTKAGDHGFSGVVNDPYQWEDTPINVINPTRLIGFTVNTRVYQDETVGPPEPDPETVGSTTTRTYIGFNVTSQSLTVGDLFVEDGFDGNTYPTNPTFVNDVGGTVSSAGTNAGITDQSAYAYAKVFDQTRFAMIPAGYVPPPAPPPVDGSTEVQTVPLEPFDPNNDVFPYFALTEYSPDQRNAVKVTYTHSISVIAGAAGSISGTINISQYVIQSIKDWTDACQFYICRSEGAYEFSAYNYCPTGAINLNEYPS